VPPHHVYGLFHVAWIVGIICASITLSLLCRRNVVPRQVIRAALTCLLVGGELLRYRTADIRFPSTLPLNLCNVTTWVAVIACLSLSPRVVEFAYFAGLSGAGMALLTPDSSAALPAAFFLNHGAIILSGSALVFGRIATLRRGAVWRAYGCLLLYMAFIGLFDWKYHVNYSFLCAKPAATTLLTFLGPWPYYLVGAGAVGLVLFWLLWLPVRPPTARNEFYRSLYPTQNVHRLLPDQ
jgi:hypothetical integral membrane protein (TIGR02206 family)